MMSKIQRSLIMYCAAALLMLLSVAVQAAERLQVQVTPKNAALQKNIEAYLHVFNEGDGQSLSTIKRRVQQQVREASQALGYYHSKITVQISDEPEPVLQIAVDSGEPVRLRSVNIQVLGEAAEL